MKFKKIFVLLLVLLIFMVLFVPLESAFASYRYNEWNSDITIQKNGNMLVREDLVMYFGSHDGGQAYHWFKRWINLDKIQDVDSIEVYEDKNGEEIPYKLGNNTPGTYTFYKENGALYIKLNYEAKDTVKHFVLKYRVVGAAQRGAIEFYDKDTLIQYYAIPKGNEVSIGKASVDIHLPDGATKDQIKAWGWGLPVGTGKVQIVSGNEVKLYGENIAPGEFIGFSIIVPKDLIMRPAGVVVHPGSGADFEKRAAEEEAHKARIAGIKTLIWLLLFLLVLVLMFLQWYKYGSDYKLPEFAEYLREPPSNLPPAVVGALLKQGATIKEVLATIIDLANRGYIKIEEIKGGFLKNTDYVYTLDRSKDTITLKPFEQKLINYLFGVLDQVKLSDLKYSFAQFLPTVYKLVNQELINNDFYEGGSPAKVKSKYFGIGFVMVFLGFFAMFFGIMMGLSFLAWPLLLGGLVVILFANAMPRKSLKGAQERMKWLAFERYLKGLLKYRKADEAKDKFAAYLPFAIVFGLDNSWIREFSRVKAPAPMWYIPYGYSNMGYGYNGSNGVASTQSFGGNSMPGVGQGFAQGMQGFSLESISHGLNSLLNSSATVFTSTKSSSSGGGGGFSGGGGFGGG
jgi:uncharacterized membrane protein